MKRYIALLRGINVSGKNKIAMPELKKCFLELGYVDVVTYLNSGNVIFSCSPEEEVNLQKRIEEMIRDRFALEKRIMIGVDKSL